MNESCMASHCLRRLDKLDLRSGPFVPVAYNLSVPIPSTDDRRRYAVLNPLGNNSACCAVQACSEAWDSVLPPIKQVHG